tara:strand:- start:279 stop:1223 length:945 start_codon:yes stop_codon:yes gene_type:complete
MIALVYTTTFLVSRMNDNASVMDWLMLMLAMVPHYVYLLLPYAMIIGFSFSIDAMRQRRYWLMLWIHGHSVRELLAYFGRVLIVLIVLIVGLLDGMGYSSKPQLDPTDRVVQDYGPLWLGNDEEFFQLNQIQRMDQVGQLNWIQINNHGLNQVSQWHNLSYVNGQWITDLAGETPHVLKDSKLLQAVTPKLLELMSSQAKYLTLYDLFQLASEPLLHSSQLADYHQAIFSRLFYPLDMFLALYITWLSAFYVNVHSNSQRRIAQPIAIGVLSFITIHFGVPMATTWDLIVIPYILVIYLLVFLSIRLDRHTRWV